MWLNLFQYRCKCREGHWSAGGAGWVSAGALSAGAPLACTPCGVGSDAAACLSDLVRVGLLACNLAGMLLCLFVGLVIFKKRKCKVRALYGKCLCLGFVKSYLLER